MFECTQNCTLTQVNVLKSENCIFLYDMWQKAGIYKSEMEKLKVWHDGSKNCVCVFLLFMIVMIMFLSSLEEVRVKGWIAYFWLRINLINICLMLRGNSSGVACTWGMRVTIYFHGSFVFWCWLSNKYLNFMQNL